MPRITISEVDQTRSVISETLENVVYIPGFATATLNMDAVQDNFSPSATNETNGVPKGYPKLCTTVTEFTQLFGSSAPAFATAQVLPQYTEPADENEGASGFSENAVYRISGSNMFNANDVDPSWVLAYDLLLNGVPVLYERVNNFYGTVKQGSVPTESTEGKQGDLIFRNTATVPETTSAIAEWDGSLGYSEGDAVLFGTSLYICISDVAAGTNPEPSEDTTHWKLYVDEDADMFVCTGSYVVDNTKKYTWEIYEDVTTGTVHFGTTSYSIESSSVVATNTLPSDATEPFTVSDMYDFLYGVAYEEKRNGVENILCGKGETDVKWVTSGGYPVFEYDVYGASDVHNAIAKKLVSLCEKRGDCIALVDHLNNPVRPLTGDTSVFGVINEVDGDYALASEFAAMFTPYVSYLSSRGSRFVPGGNAFLITMAECVKTSPNWMAVAGVTRGIVPGATRLSQKVTNSIADNYVDSMTHGGICINPVTYIRNYGFTIWGNRTLAATTANTEKALYYLNMRSLLCEVKKVCFSAAQSLMFEQNSDILWINFKSKITPLLDQMTTSAGLAAYKIIKVDTDSKTEVSAVIKLYPIYAVEAFDIVVTLTNEDVEVEEA